MFLVNLVLLGVATWPKLVGLHRAYEPLPATVFCFWAALGALSAVGVRHPLPMLPLLFLQLLYKSLWVLAIWLPLQVAGGPADMSVGRLDLAVVMLGGAAMDLLVIPWGYVAGRFGPARDARTAVRRRPFEDAVSMR